MPSLDAMNDARLLEVAKQLLANAGIPFPSDPGLQGKTAPYNYATATEQAQAQKGNFTPRQAAKAESDKEISDAIYSANAAKIAAAKIALNKLEADKTAADKAAADKAAVDKIVTNKAADKIALDKIEADKIAADKAEADKIAADKAAADKIAADKAAADKIVTDKTASEKVTLDKLEAEKVAADKIAAEKVAADKIAAEKVAADKIAADKIASDKVIVVPTPTPTPKLDMSSERKSIIAILTDRFTKYGLGTLAKKITDLGIDGATESTITFALQESEEYKMRFSANDDRIKKGLRVLDPAQYINLEDTYRQTLRAYGLKQFDNDDYVKQFIANDMSTTELSTRVQTAVQRIQNSDPQISKTLKDFYGIGQEDLVGYMLDPETSLQKIQRQVAAAEIGNAARVQGLEAGVAVSEQLAAQGISEAEAQRGYSTIADILPTADKLSAIYGKTLPEYGQKEGEQEQFNGLASAQRKRKNLSAAEIAQFSGSSGTGRSSLSTNSSGQL